MTGWCTLHSGTLSLFSFLRLLSNAIFCITQIIKPNSIHFNCFTAYKSLLLVTFMYENGIIHVQQDNIFKISLTYYDYVK